MDVVSIDFSRIFDKVPKGMLIQKIKMQGTNNDFVVWIQNRLTHMRRRVSVKSVAQTVELWPVQLHRNLCC